MTEASIEATLELWASSLCEVKARMRPLFSRARVAASANSFLDGLLGDERRKTGWMRAEAVGDGGPWRQLKAIPGRGQWDADALRDVVRDYALEHLGADDAVLVIDETGFLRGGSGNLNSGDKWIADVTAAKLAVSRRQMSKRPRRNHSPAFKAKVDPGRRERREDAGRTGASL